MAEFHIKAGNVKFIRGCCKIPSAKGLGERTFIVPSISTLAYFASNGWNSTIFFSNLFTVYIRGALVESMNSSTNGRTKAVASYEWQRLADEHDSHFIVFTRMVGFSRNFVRTTSMTWSVKASMSWTLERRPLISLEPSSPFEEKDEEH